MRRALAVMMMATGIASCRTDKMPTGVGARIPVVHAVLNPAAFEHRILAEWMLSGRIDTTGASAPTDPIRSGAGEPMAGALLIMRGPTGDSAIAEEMIGTDGGSTGVYRFFNADKPSDTVVARRYLRLTPGETYDLELRSPEGHVVRGSARIPQATPAPLFPPPAETFNRDLDSLYLLWQEIPTAARYLVAVESPRGQLRLFVPRNEYLMAGGLRHGEVDNAPKVFIPGFEQTVWIAAVDEGFYDYYRSENDEFTGRGLQGNLSGGLGFLGSLIVLRQHRLRVIGTQYLPFGGQWSRETGTAGPTAFTLYIEADLSGGEQLSGSWFRAGNPAGILGVAQGQRVTLAFLEGQTLADTADVFVGQHDGQNRLVGRWRTADTDASYVRSSP